MVFWIRFLAMCLLLSGCGGGGGGDGGGGDGGAGGDIPGEVVDPRLARLDAYDAQWTRVLGDPVAGLPGIAPTTGDLPTTGAATFSGFATVSVEGPQPLVLVGDTRLEVDFGAGASSGVMSGFFGTVPGGGVQDFAGEIAVTNGQVAHDLQLGYSGALSGSGQQIAVSGRLTGAFLGDPVRALSVADLDPTVVQNGVARTGTVVLVAEQVVPP